MVASMDFMTEEAVLRDRRMFERIGSPLLRMALVTEFIDRIRPDHLRPQTAVGIVAIETFDPSLPDGMMGLFIRLGPNVLVAREAQLGFSALQGLPRSFVNGMALIAGDIGRLMPADIPEGRTLRFLVAGEAS